MVYPGQGAPLGHTYKLGAWYDSERFADQAVGTDGLSLVSPNSNSQPRLHHGDYSVYAVADQMVWRQPDDPNRSVSLFSRVMDTPEGDRNLVDFSLNAGLVYHDPLPNRADDTLAVGLGYAHVSNRVQAYDRALAAFDPSVYMPIQTTETYLEASYQYQVHPWWQVQPDVQFVFNPGGGLVNPNSPTQRIKNELVFGLRTNVLF
jgi:porin